MAGVNKVILVGNLGKDPKVSTLNSGDKVVSFTLATSESWKDKNTGERREKTEWHRVVIFNEGLAKVAEQFLKKGSKVYLEGALQTRKWTDQAGVEKYSTEVVLQNFNSNLTLLDGRQDGPGGGQRSQGGQAGYDDYDSGPSQVSDNRQPARSQPAARAPQNAPSFSRDMDDDIPF